MRKQSASFERKEKTFTFIKDVELRKDWNLLTFSAFIVDNFFYVLNFF